jgi:hypothetical protein
MGTAARPMRAVPSPLACQRRSQAWTDWRLIPYRSATTVSGMPPQHLLDHGQRCSTTLSSHNTAGLPGRTAVHNTSRPSQDSRNHQPRPTCQASPEPAQRGPRVRVRVSLHPQGRPAGGGLRRPSSRRQYHDGNRPHRCPRAVHSRAVLECKQPDLSHVRHRIGETEVWSATPPPSDAQPPGPWGGSGRFRSRSLWSEGYMGVGLGALPSK